MISNKSPKTQILFFVESRDIKSAMSALKVGTYHYAKLPVRDEELRLLIETAIERQPQYGKNILLSDAKVYVRLDQLAGSSEPMQQVYQKIQKAAETDIPILLLGETGTGKDLAAQAIHRNSKRRDGSYIPVNLGSLPSELVSSELFGHEKGAFTGASKVYKGKFEQAAKGTIFLDEVDCINKKTQISLLRLIERNNFYRLGGSVSINSNCRLIAASNSNLLELVQAGSFREDLFYRLDVFPIELPPLRERKKDIQLLVEEFLTYFNKLFKKNILYISPKFIQKLEDYHYPGNVRELKNILQRAVLVCNQEKILSTHLPARFSEDKSNRSKIVIELGISLEEAEKKMILQALKASGNNRTRAAELLGISRRAIYNKLNKHNMK